MPSKIVLKLPPTKQNPRNSEGAFVTLTDGRLLFAYCRFEGNSPADHAPCKLAVRYSCDGGKSWSSRDRIIVENEAKGKDKVNVMSPSLLRLQDGRIALFYLRKDSPIDCHACMRTSTDEGETWSDPTQCTQAPGYFILNNDRVIQLRNGRLIMPLAFHRGKTMGRDIDWDPRSISMYLRSDDNGCTWHESDDWWALPVHSESGLQEPGAVELKRGKLYGWGRTDTGCQWEMRSNDGGVRWTPPQPSRFKSPLSPMSIKRIPETGDLLAVWNDYSNKWKLPKPTAGCKRTPLTLATSSDEGKTWRNARLIETARNRGYCYIAIHFVENTVLLAYSCGLGIDWGLTESCIRRITLDWIYH